MSDRKQDRLGWSIPYDFNIAASIDTGRAGRFKYSPDFVGVHCLRRCTIRMTGSRYSDYRAAEQSTGGPRNRGETWHHLFPMGGRLNQDINGYYYCDMELVSTRTHRQCCPHLGSVSLYPFPYRMPETARSIAELVSSPLQVPPDLARNLWAHGASYALVPFGKSGGGEQIYIETIYTQQEAADTIQDMSIYPWFDTLITNLGWYPIAEDSGGNILFWLQTGKILDGIFLYVLHDECVGENCERFCAFSTCGVDYPAFTEKFLSALSTLP
jgi:hypothetical protein